MTVREVLGNISMVGFCVLAIACGRQWRRGDASIRWATAAFGSLASIGLIGKALELRASPELFVWFGKGILLILCLFPYLLYRFAMAYQPPSRRLSALAVSSTVAVALATLALPWLPIPIPGYVIPVWWTWYRILILVQWTVLFSMAGHRLWNAARHEVTVARSRLQTLAVGTAGLNAAILLSGAGAGPNSEALRSLVSLLALMSATLFFVGLSPPAILVQRWLRADHLAVQRGMGELFLAETQAEVCAALLPHARLVGARAAAMVSPAGEIIGRFGDVDADGAVVELASAEVSTLPVEVRRLDLRAGTLLVWTSRYAPFFGDADMTTLEALGHFADIVMDRCALVEAQRCSKLELAFQATHDPLTGLPNRALLYDRLGQALARPDAIRRGVAVLFLDVDRFKSVNDTLGHALGDEVLCSIAGRLNGIVRPGDTVARFGGDEFVVIAEGPFVDDDPSAIARRIAGCLTDPITVHGTRIEVTVSTGFAVARPGDDADALLGHADTAMYMAKDDGRDRYLKFDSTMRRRADRRHLVETALRDAIANDTLVVRYQPTIELVSGRVAGVEALARCPLGDEELAPDEFIPIAEETGLIIPLGALVLRRACQQVTRWQREIPGLARLVVSVNRSATELLMPDASSDVAATLSASGLEPSLLCLEITESVLLKDAASSARALTALKGLGVSIAVDDFGTGYSSLTYLKQFPVDVLKIDRSFVWGLDASVDSPGDRAIVAGVIDLAHAFGLTATAEGVETADQLARLRQLGCELAQGYFLGVPMTAEEATVWLADAQRRATVPPTRSHHLAGERRRVLVVDDDRTARTLLCLAMADHPRYEVVAEAGDGREAVAAARHHQPDVVLLDLAMPGVGGLTALPLIRAVAPAVDVVVVSGLDDREVEAEALALGARGVLCKGTGPDLLLARLDSVLSPRVRSLAG